MSHVVQEEEREEPFYLRMPAVPLTKSFVEEGMEGLLTERLENFTQRGSGHVLKSIETLDWQVAEC